MKEWMMVNGEGEGKIVGELKDMKEKKKFILGIEESYVGKWIIKVMKMILVKRIFEGVVEFKKGVER